MTDDAAAVSPGQLEARVARLPAGAIPAIAILLVAVTFGLVVSRAVALDLPSRPTLWVVNAIPVALSELYFGHPERYTSLDSVRNRFFQRVSADNPTTRTINAAMRQIATMKRADLGDSYAPLGPDDKGIVDLVELSFLLFGFQLQSVMKLYVALLLVSSLLFVAAFWRYPSHLLLLAVFLGMLYLVMPMMTYNPQLRSVVALRVLPILSMVACLHILLLLVAGFRRPVGALQFGLAALQVTLIAFTIHMRATTIWQVVTIVGVGVAALAYLSLLVRWTGRPRQSSRTTALTIAAVMGLTMCAYGSVRLYQAVSLPDVYRRGDEIATRVFWHNIFSGFALHPEFSERFRLRIDDVSITAATRVYLDEIGRLDIWQNMGGDVPNFEGIKFAQYDPVVRDMLVYRCRTYLRECIETMVYYKPRSLLGNLAWIYGLRPQPPDLDVVVSERFGDIVQRHVLATTYLMDASGQRAYLWSPVLLVVALLFIPLIRAEPRLRTQDALIACGALTLGSLIPIMVGYPLPHTIAEAAISTGMLIYGVVCVAGSAGLALLLAQVGRQRLASRRTVSVRRLLRRA